MLTRLLKLLSGLIPLWGRGGVPARGGAYGRDIGELFVACSPRTDREALAPDRIGDSPHPPTRADYSSDLDFIIDRHAWEWPGSPWIGRVKAELGRLRAGGTGQATDPDFIIRRHDAAAELDFIIRHHDAEWRGDAAAAAAELDRLRTGIGVRLISSNRDKVDKANPRHPHGGATMDTRWTKDDDGTERWRRGAGDEEVGADVFPLGPSERRPRHDEVLVWKASAYYFGSALSCTLREWADWTGEGRRVRRLVRATLGREAHDRVDDAVRASLPSVRALMEGDLAKVVRERA